MFSIKTVTIGNREKTDVVMFPVFPIVAFDADEMKQDIAELEYVIARYGMCKIRFSSSSTT